MTDSKREFKFSFHSALDHHLVSRVKGESVRARVSGRQARAYSSSYGKPCNSLSARFQGLFIYSLVIFCLSSLRLAIYEEALMCSSELNESVI